MTVSYAPKATHGVQELVRMGHSDLSGRDTTRPWIFSALVGVAYYYSERRHVKSKKLIPNAIGVGLLARAFLFLGEGG